MGLLDRFVQLLLGPLSVGLAVVPLIQQLLDDGSRPEWIASQLLVAAARRLGELWLLDECSFLDVTIATQRLGAALIDLESLCPAPTRVCTGEILLAPAPNDQHGFGLSVLGFFLRRAGWAVAAPVLATAPRIGEEVAARRYDAVGLSVGHERALPGVAAVIRRIRVQSCNPGIVVAVGGPVITECPERAASLGADLWAEDADGFVTALGRGVVCCDSNAG